MTGEQIERAIASGALFTLHMVDGKEYEVPHPEDIGSHRGSAYVLVHEDDGHFNVLPLLTMTGLRARATERTPGEMNRGNRRRAAAVNGGRGSGSRRKTHS